MAELFPPEFDDLRDLPHTLFDLIRQALLFLSFDELPAKDVPPRRIWLDGEKLRAWFDEVKRRREREAGGSDAAWDQPIEDPVQNAAAQELIVGG